MNWITWVLWVFSVHNSGPLYIRTYVQNLLIITYVAECYSDSTSWHVNEQNIPVRIPVFCKRFPPNFGTIHVNSVILSGFSKTILFRSHSIDQLQILQDFRFWSALSDNGDNFSQRIDFHNSFLVLSCSKVKIQVVRKGWLYSLGHVFCISPILC